MDTEVDRLRTELASHNEQVSRWAAVWAGNHGVEAVPLLPKLFEMIEEKLNDSRDWFPWGEYISVGRILRELNKTIEAGSASDEQRTTFANSYEKILSHMDVATGASASLLIYNLVLIGPRARDASQIVLDLVLRTGDERLRHRAYQYAYFVDRGLLDQLPWSTFGPLDPMERAKWELSPE